jgi:hypothetical protein
MAIEKSVSFRSSLLANTLDLTQNVGWQCARTSRLIAGIVSQLAVYTEEGVAMTPSVFICSSVARLVQLAGVGEFIPLSDDVPLESAGPKLLKAAAPLCSGHWRIYIERSASGEFCKYGVFCGSSDPTSLTIDEVVLDEFEEEFPVIRITQSATNKVEVRTSVGDGIEFRFNNDNDVAELKAHEHIKLLSLAISRNSGLLHERFVGYVDRILSAAIKNCHGTLIAVVPANDAEFPVTLADIVRLNPPFHLYSRYQAHIDEGMTAASVSRLQAASELVSGFIGSDGITVFNDAGYVLGYRAFIHSDNGGKPMAGGARSRAYESMKSLVGTDLTAAFFRSQDGRTEFIKSDLEKQK